MQISIENINLENEIDWHFILKNKNPTMLLFPFWRYFEKIHSNIFNSLNILNHSITEQYLRKIIVCHMKTVLLELVKRTLTWEFNVCLKKKNKINLKAFLKNISTAEQLDILFRKYPVMQELFIKCLSNYQSFSTKLINRLHSDFSELKTIFKLDKMCLISYEILGDSHCGGNRVTSLRFQHINSRKIKNIIYKPRKIHLEKYFGEFIGFFKKIMPEMALKQINILSKKSHGWMEYVKQIPVLPPSENQYYYQIGLLVGICYVLNGQDMHYENLVACGINPVLVDLECLFSPPITREHYENKNYPSISETLLLPAKANPTEKQFDLSALLSHSKQISFISTLMVKGDFINNLHIERIFAKLLPSKNVLFNKSTDTAFSPSIYRFEIANGYSDLIKNTIDNKELILNFICQTQSDFASRVIYRPTFLYASLLQESYHPKLLADPKKYYDFLTSQLNNHNNNALIKHEIFDLMNGDIPYFSSAINSMEIRNSKEEKISLSSFEAGIKRVMNKINILGLSNIDESRELIIDTLENYYV